MKRKRKKPLSGPLYSVKTFDYDLGKYTPQVGLDEGPFTLWELRGVLRELRSLGYMGTRSDHDIIVVRRLEGTLLMFAVGGERTE